MFISVITTTVNSHLADTLLLQSPRLADNNKYGQELDPQQK